MIVINKRTHILFGKLLLEAAEDVCGIRLDKQSFLFGNILPDLCFSFLPRPHNVGVTLGMIRKRTRRLMNDKHAAADFGKTYTRRLGVICHYYADYFCYAHQKNYTGDLAAHVLHEKNLRQYIIEHSGAIVPDCRILNEQGVNLDDRFEQMQREYQLCAPSLDRDVYFSLRMCLEAIVLIARASVFEPSCADTFDGQLAQAVQ